MTKTIPIIVAGLITAAGCSGGKEKTVTQQTEVPANNAANPQPEKSVIPAELMTPGLEYLGAPFSRNIVYVVHGLQQGEPQMGAMNTSIEKIENGKVFVKASWQGDLAAILQDSSYTASKEGVFATTTQGRDIVPPVMMIPADVEPGKTWSGKYKFNMGEQNLNANSTWKALKIEKVTVPLGTFDAIAISESGTFTGEGVKLTQTGTTWYAKGIGVLKSELKGSMQQGSTKRDITITITATKFAEQ